MDKLDRAVDIGIITARQAAEIRALPDPEGTLKLSLVHVLWAGGCALVVFAMVLLAVEIADDDPWTYMVVCLTYGAFLYALDWAIRGQRSMRLLSSLVFLAVGFCLFFAVLAWQMAVGEPEAFRSWTDIPRWSLDTEEPPMIAYAPLIHGPYLLFLPLLVIGSVLLLRRSFLPAWVAVLGTLMIYVSDIYYGLNIDAALDESRFYIVMGIIMTAAAWRFDLKAPVNHGYWVNKLGLIALTIGGTALAEREEFTLVLGGALLLIIVSLYIRRSAGLPLGAGGVAVYLAEWFDAWDNYFVAAALLAFIGFLTILAGIRAHLLEAGLDEMLPASLRRMRPQHRDDPVTFGF